MVDASFESPLGEGPGLIIRAAQKEDAQAVADVKRRSWQAAYRGILPDDFLDNLPLVPPPDAWVTAVDEGHAPLVAEKSGEIVAIAAVGEARDEDVPDGTGELLMIYALEEVWGTGVGHSLHEAAVDRLRNAGHTEAILWMMSGNRRAASFYEAHGWQPDGTTRDRRFGEVEVQTRRFQRTLTAG